MRPRSKIEPCQAQTFAFAHVVLCHCAGVAAVYDAMACLERDISRPRFVYVQQGLSEKIKEFLRHDGLFRTRNLFPKKQKASLIGSNVRANGPARMRTRIKY